jgi:hypothetical protein
MNTPIFRKCLFALVAALAALSPAWAAEPMRPLASGGKPGYRIVVGRDASDAELLAVAELSKYLGTVAGTVTDGTLKTYYGSGPIAEGQQGSNEPCIYVGWTDFAKTNGLDGSTMKPEEWAVKTVGTNLILTGGRPRGTLYAVYDFLQKDLGVHWLDRDTEIVPKRAMLALAAMDRRVKPVLQMRDCYTRFRIGWDWDKATVEKEQRFRSRNRQNQFGYCGPEQLPYGGDDRTGPIGNQAHTFAQYVPADKYFAEHPEFYALDKYGQTRQPTGPKPYNTAESRGKGGLCLTHPQVREIALASLLEMIAADRATFNNPGQPAPTLYNITQPDNDVVCHCPECRKLVEREGSESGPLIDFINELAAGVSGKYPDVKLLTFAYMWSQIPPKTLRPAANVVILWADWGMPAAPPEMKMPDPWHPLSSPINYWRAENLRQWAAITPGGLCVWDYGELYAVPAWPFTLAPVLAEDLRFLGKFRLLGLFLETEEWHNGLNPGANGQFSPLYNWLAMQLMVDPEQPVEPLIATFMAGYYGPAAASMRAFYDKLVAAQRKLPPRSSGAVPIQIEYVTAAFFTESQALLEQAEKACAAGSLEQAHVQRERWRLDYSLLDCWNTLRKKLAPGAALPFDREATLARIENSRALWLRLGYPEKKVNAVLAGSVKEKLQYWRRPVMPLPELFRNVPEKDVVQYHASEFGEHRRVLLPDPEAAAGKTIRFRPDPPDLVSKPYAAQPQFALYDFARKENGPSLTIGRAEIPQDGKYHWYKVGRWRIQPGVILYTMGWLLQFHNLAKDAYVPNDLPGAQDWTVWVSAKFTGPAYITDSQEKENGFYIDRIALVKPDEGDGRK